MASVRERPFRGTLAMGAGAWYGADGTFVAKLNLAESGFHEEAGRTVVGPTTRI